MTNIAKKALKIPIKLLKWTGILVFFVIIALIAIPYFFKDELKELVIDEVNKTLNAELALDDFDLTFFSTFPNMTIELIGVKLQGVDEFQNITLAEMKLLQAKVGFWSVIVGDKIEIDEIHIVEPKFDVRVLQDGTANYDIVKTDEELAEENETVEESSFELALNEYSISDGMITYSDEPGNMYAKIVNLNHTGSGDMTADIIDFKTTTSMDKLTYEMDGTPYLSEVKTDLIINLLMEFAENTSKFTLQENLIQLNALKFSIDGFYEMFEKHDEIDMKINADKTTFKDLLSLIPAFYQSGYEGMISSGSISINAMTKGKLDDTNFPAWDATMKIINASIKYPDLPGKISNIQVNAGSKFPGGSNLDLMTISVPQFHANLSENTIDAKLLMKRLISDPSIDAKILANLNLATLKDFVPMAKGESYSGILDADVKIKGDMSDLENNDFEKFTAEGQLILSEMLYKSPDLPNEVDIETMKFTFSPQNLEMNELKAKMGKSDFAINGQIDNYLGYALRDEVLKGDFTYHSNYLDLDELVPASELTSETTEGNSQSTTTADGGEPVLVPRNIDFNLNTSIDAIKYDGLSIKSVDGNVHLKDEIATLENLTLNAMGGSIGLTGDYNTQDHSKPKMNFGYVLKDIDIHELAVNFNTIESLAPITKYARGRISSSFDMSTDLTAGFEPILSSLASVGDIRSNSISLEGVKLFDKIESVTKLKSLSSQTIKNFKTKFTVEDGKIKTSPFDIKLGKIGSEVSGFTTLEQKMDYSMKMNVPKEEIPAAIIKEVEAAMSKLNAFIPNLNMGSLPAFIPVNVKMIGDISNPKITTDFKESILKATGDFKDNLIENVKETIKDSVSTIINEQVDNAKEELEKQKQKILADAQKQANKIVVEAKKAGDLIRAEADKQAKDLVKNAGSNPIKKRIAQEAGKKIISTADKKAKDIETEGQKQAEKVMTVARDKANKLG
ncbi:MAG: hypothetical protein ACKVJC_00440 [Flavobacteriales bacterium]